METNEDFELVDSFITESLEMLEEVEPIFVELSGSDSCTMNDESIGAAFRLYHSIKGAASFLGFPNITGITHSAETLLGLVRSGSIPLSSAFVEVQLETIDALREIITTVSESRSDAAFANQRDFLVERLDTFMNRESGGGGASASKPASSGTAPVAAREPVPVAAAAAPVVDDAAPGISPTEDPALEDIPEFVITDEMRMRFCQDSSEVLEEAEQALLALESADGEERTSLLALAFRQIHSFKGNCGFMQLADLERLSHKMETILGLMRDGSISPGDKNINVLLKSLDLLKGAMSKVSAGESAEIMSCNAMIQFMDEYVIGAQAAPAPAAQSEAKPQPAAAQEKEKDVFEDKLDAFSPSPASEATESSGKAEGAGIPADKASKVVSGSKGSIRVDVEKLDMLINLVGELIIAEAMVLRHDALLTIEDETLDRGIHQLKRVSSDLQDVAMSVRMIPLSATFRRMIRLVHDTGRKSGKHVELSLVGEDTEVDKNVIEQIGDPLVHIIRNSVDHGIEPSPDRIAAGKPEAGLVVLEARHEGGEVWISIRDDGRGLNRDKILAKAMERGLISKGDESLRDEEIYEFIFHPGFSTADKVTDLSGRGVGMDVVKKNIEALNGKVRVKSTAGKGTEIILQIPLTMAIIEGMLVRVGDGKYTLPLLAIRECLPHPSRESITVMPDGSENILVRGDLIPILRLYDVFRKQGAEQDVTKGILVIVQSESEPVALLVDELIGQQETVIKGLSSYLGAARGLSGCTVLGNGEVSLIIDVNGLVRMREETLQSGAVAG
jgi:two-component system, chemotaxis family, sensor kinase CheA